MHLSVSTDAIRHRLTTRTDNDFGKDPRDLADVLGWNASVTRRNASYGAHVVDADQPLSRVLQQLLDLAPRGQDPTPAGPGDGQHG